MAAQQKHKQSGGAGAFGSGALTLNLAALRHNYQVLRRAAGGAEVAAAVKADAYGLGAADIAPALFQAGCRLFFVAHYEEAAALARALRRAAGASGQSKGAAAARIAILNDVWPQQAAACARAGFIPVLNSLESVRLWAALSAGKKRPPEVMLQCDSGMARLGLDAAELRALIKAPGQAAQLKVTAALSHLACGDDAQSPMNAAQAARFTADARTLAAALAPGARGARLSLAASHGLALGAGFHFGIVRAGLALYGILDTAGAPPPWAAELRPVMALSARVLRVSALQKGETAGYGACYRAARAHWAATVSAGYADGWPRALSNKGAVYYQGARLPVIGRISMDCMTVSLEPLAKAGIALPARGAWVELIGPHQSLSAAARAAGLIPYELLTGLGRRWRKRLLDA